MREEEQIKAERKIENGGNSEGVAWVEGETLEGTGVVETGEGSATRIGEIGGAIYKEKWNYAHADIRLIRIAGTKQKVWVPQEQYIT